MSANIEVDTTIWRTSGGGNHRAGLFDQAIQIKASTPKRLQAQGSIRASAVFDRQGNAYFADMAGGVQSFVKDGSSRWRIMLPAGVTATPVLNIGDDCLYAGTLDGHVYALDSSNGKEKWQTQIPSKSDPRILSDLLYLPQRKELVLNSWGGLFHALDSENGESKNTWDAGISPYSSAAATGDETLFSVQAIWSDPKEGVSLVKIDPKTGSTQEIFFKEHGRKHANRMPTAASPILDEKQKTLYFITNVDREGILHAYSVELGKPLWEKRFHRFLTATPALLADGRIVAADMNGVVYILSSEGEIQGRYHSGAYYLTTGPVCYGQESIIIGDPEGKIHIIEPSGVGQVIFEAERSIHARPSIDPEGRLFVPSMDGGVYVFSPGRS